MACKGAEEGVNADTARDPQVGSATDISGQPEWLTRNYYQTHWMVGARHVAEYQIVTWSLLLVIMTPVPKTSTLQIFLSFMSWLFVSQPVLSYCYIFLGILYEDAQEFHEDAEESYREGEKNRKSCHRGATEYPGSAQFDVSCHMSYHACRIMLFSLIFHLLCLGSCLRAWCGTFVLYYNDFDGRIKTRIGPFAICSNNTGPTDKGRS